MERLAQGRQPHGFPEAGVAVDPSLRANLRHLASKLEDSGRTLSQIALAVDELEREATLARRHYEAVVDGLHRLLEAAGGR
jgi:hypothetical protein